MTIETNRILGSLGACFTVVGAVSSVLSGIRLVTPASSAANLAATAVTSIFGVISLLGFILFLIAMYGFSRDYHEHRIFNLVIYGIVAAIVAAIVIIVIWLAFFIAALVSIVPNLNTPPSTSEIMPLIWPYIAPLVAAFGFVGLVSIIFHVKAFNLLADKSAVPLFKTAAKVLLAGGLVTVVIGIIYSAFAVVTLASFDFFSVTAIPGGLLQSVAWALLAIAFFRVKAPPTQTFTPPPPAYAPSTQAIYCTHCGAQNPADAVYCSRCGQRL